MSAGWKKNCSWGNCRGSSGRRGPSTWRCEPQAADQLRRRRVLRLQRDQDLAVHRTDGGGVAQCDVHAAVGQPDIVQDRVDLTVAGDGAAPGFPPPEVLLVL